MSKKQMYIAYGSNINLEQMAYRCPHSKVVGNWRRSECSAILSYYTAPRSLTARRSKQYG